MERFVKRHEGRIKGIITGFDRILFRGTLRSISYSKGIEKWLWSVGVPLKRFKPEALKFSERLKSHAKAIAEKHGRPFLYVQSSKQSKEEMALKIMKKEGITKGLICVLSCVEPCLSASLHKDWQDKMLHLIFGERKCLHLYFYYLDREFGLMHIRLQTWLPFTIQVCVNGWEYLALRMDQAGIEYEKRDNCFTHIADIAKAQKMMDSLIERKWVHWLNVLARRVNPWIDPAAGLNLRGYYWSIRQSEYATDVMFKDATTLAAIYPALIRHANLHFSCNDILRFLGRRTNIRFNGEVRAELRQRAEGVRIRHFVEENSIKMYDKQALVLRIETTINNPRRFKVYRQATRKGQKVMAWIPMRKGIIDIRRRVEVCRAANERYLEALSVVGEPRPSHQLLDSVSQPVVRFGQSHRPLQPISPKEAELFAAVMRGEFLVQGFRNRQIRPYLEPAAGNDPAELRRAAGRVTRKLRLLRAHGLIAKVPRTQYYRITDKGHKIMATSLSFRESNIALLNQAA